MAIAMRKMAQYLGLVDSDEYNDGYDFPDLTAHMPPEPVLPRTPMSSSNSSSVGSHTSSFPSSSSSTMGRSATATMNPPQTGYATNTTPAAPAREMYRIATIHPRTYNDARRIGEDFRQGIPVIMNLSDMDDADARRIVDFAAGLAFGLHGAIERVAKGVFLLSPANVDIGAAARAQLREDSFFNQS